MQDPLLNTPETPLLSLRQVRLFWPQLIKPLLLICICFALVDSQCSADRLRCLLAQSAGAGTCTSVPVCVVIVYTPLHGKCIIPERRARTGSHDSGKR